MPYYPPVTPATTAGDTEYATGPNALARLPIGTAYQALQTNAGATAPQWGGYPIPTIGRPQISGGAVQYGVPNVQWVNGGAIAALSVNQDRSEWFQLTEPITIDSVLVEVTTAPASDTTLYVAVYTIDGNWQQIGNPQINKTMSVTNAGGAAIYTVAVSPGVALPPGMYCTVVNVGVAMSVRRALGGIAGWTPGSGANPITCNGVSSRAAAAFPNGGTPWTSGGSSTAGTHAVFLRWS